MNLKFKLNEIDVFFPTVPPTTSENAIYLFFKEYNNIHALYACKEYIWRLKNDSGFKEIFYKRLA
jgi:hypothetical protein